MTFDEAAASIGIYPGSQSYKEAQTIYRAALAAKPYGIAFETPEVWREALEAIAQTRASPACARIAKAALAAAPTSSGEGG